MNEWQEVPKIKHCSINPTEGNMLKVLKENGLTNGESLNGSWWPSSCSFWRRI